MNDQELDDLVKRALEKTPERDEPALKRRVFVAIREAAGEERAPRGWRPALKRPLWHRLALAGGIAAAVAVFLIPRVLNRNGVERAETVDSAAEPNYGPMPPPVDPHLKIALSASFAETSPVHHAHLFQSDPLLRPHSRWETTEERMKDEI